MLLNPGNGCPDLHQELNKLHDPSYLSIVPLFWLLAAGMADTHSSSQGRGQAPHQKQGQRPALLFASEA